MTSVAPLDRIEPMSSSRAEYYSDLDVARGVLMVLGVVLHSANLFHTDVFAVYAADANPVAYKYIAGAIHLFRMPAFFAVSGFFCAMALRRQNPRTFLSVRSRRILVPLMTTLLTLNMLELWLRQRAAASSASFYLAGISVSEVLFHLWFLVVLFVYFLAAATCFAGFGKITRRHDKQIKAILSKIECAPRITLCLWLVTSFLLAYVPNALGSLLPALVYVSWLFGVAPFTIIEYAPYFAFGVALNFLPVQTQLWRDFRWAKVVLFALAIAFVPTIAMSGAVNENLVIGIWALGAWICVLTIFGLFGGLTRIVGNKTKFFAEPAYTIYLLHHLLVYSLGWFLLSRGIKGFAGFTLIIFITLSLTLVFHFKLLHHSKLLRFLFNGK